MGRTAIDPLIRYQAKIDHQGPGECWPWLAARFEKGYGAFRIGSKQKKAHRVGYELLLGPIPDGLYVCHTCDNPPCQNPRHWFLGTTSDNAVDRERKGRGGPRRPFPKGHTLTRGERSATAKLTEADVHEIRAMIQRGERHGRIAQRFGVSAALVSRILHGRAWAHVPQRATG